MPYLAAVYAAALLAGAGSPADADDYPLADFSAYCVADRADPVAIKAAALQAGWVVSKSTDEETELHRTEGDRDRSFNLFESLHGGFRIRGCMAGLMPGSAEVVASLKRFMGTPPTNTNGGFATWDFVERDGKKTFLSDQEAEAAQKRGETLVMISAALRGPLAAATYIEVSKVAK